MNETDYQKKLVEISEKIANSNMPENEKMELILSIFNKHINLMITGGTGCGKSSTINALFNVEKAKVGTGNDPETMSITKYQMGSLTIWDTPGLGDSSKDEMHKKSIIDMLHKEDENGDPIIDLVLVIVNGSNRNMGSDYELINNVLIPNLGKDPYKRIIVAINQADAAMKGRHWDHEKNKPDKVLTEFLNNKAESVRIRIKESTGLDVETIYYSAGYKENDETAQEPAYNLSCLLDYILRFTPNEKRIVYAINLNKNAENFICNDGKADYNKHIKSSFGEVFKDFFEDCVFEGEWKGRNLGVPGEIAGKAIGAVVGVFGGFFKGVCNLFK